MVSIIEKKITPTMYFTVFQSIKNIINIFNTLTSHKSEKKQAKKFCPSARITIFVYRLC